MQLGGIVGIPETIVIIIFTGALGAWLAKTQGALALRNFKETSNAGKMPHREVTDGLLILIAGAVLITPGFLTDAIGFFLLIPPCRALVRGRLASFLKKNVSVNTPFGPISAENSPETGSEQARPVKGRVIEADVLDD